jgi:hypothetical protein
MMRVGKILAFAGVLLLALTAGCNAERSATADDAAGPSSDLASAARQVVAAFEARDGEQLARLVHPAQGVRFSPYAYVDVAQDRVFLPAQMARFWQDQQIYRWGVADGSGEPIDLTPAQYAKRYIVDRDFAHPTSLGIDADRAWGNTLNNAAAAYPEGRRVELYVEPAADQGDSSFDWAALRLVFQQLNGVWYLVGVIHDEWTT